jgi:quercetin dioxygenase-like cupin family protein
MTHNVIASEDGGMTHPEPGLRRQVMSTSDRLMLVRHRMDAGWVGAAHSHPHEQVIYVVRGEVHLTADSTTHTLRAGDSLMIPGNVEHRATTPVESEILDVFTPAREDYR